jgi:hypothetical protein
MATPSLTPNAGSPTKRPFGIIVAESYFVTFVGINSFRLISDIDFYTRRASRLNLHFLKFFGEPMKISEVATVVLSVLAFIGLQRMRRWGRWLAMVFAGASVAYAIWFYSAVLIFRMWTLVPHHAWPYLKNAIQLGFGIYILLFLLQPKTRQAFRPLKPSWTGESDANS